MHQTVLVSFIILMGCSHHDEANSPTPLVSASSVEVANYTTLAFSKGSSELNAETRAQLDTFALGALRDGREIRDIKVLAWADKEYPVRSNKSGRKDVELAQKRNAVIKRYLREDLHAENDIDLYNMASKALIILDFVEPNKE
jgi:outer membrane protein OmpA-like peptidoglycan-associated protein